MTLGRLAAALSALGLGLGIVLPGSPARGQEPPALRVFAAASLTDVVTELAGRFDGARVEPSFAGSSTLARQIRDGAPADVFLSASADWIDFLREAGAIAGDAIVFARNRLVCIAPRASPLAAHDVRDPRTLLARIGEADGVAIADEGVPAGEVARRALAHAGVLDAFGPRLVGRRDVRAVLHGVEQGELAAGFVYATDARIADVEVLFAFDPSTHPLIAYRAAALRGAKGPVARRFVESLLGEPARTLLADAGFALP